MGNSIREIWHSAVGSAVWEAVRKWGAPVSAFLMGIWGWFESVPGPFIAVLAIATVGAVFWTINQIDSWKTRSSQVASFSSGQKRGGLTIHYAGYGLGFGQYRDVTRQVQSLIENGKLYRRVDEKSLQCDPYPGQIKHLFVIYSHGTIEGTKSDPVQDGQLIELPKI
jgi:hypothetical protein